MIEITEKTFGGLLNFSDSSSSNFLNFWSPKTNNVGVKYTPESKEEWVNIVDTHFDETFNTLTPLADATDIAAKFQRQVLKTLVRSKLIAAYDGDKDGKDCTNSRNKPRKRATHKIRPLKQAPPPRQQQPSPSTTQNVEEHVGKHAASVASFATVSHRFCWKKN